MESEDESESERDPDERFRQAGFFPFFVRLPQASGLRRPDALHDAVTPPPPSVAVAVAVTVTVRGCSRALPRL